MKVEILINICDICALCHNFLEKTLLRSLMPIYKPYIIATVSKRKVS